MPSSLEQSPAAHPSTNTKCDNARAVASKDTERRVALHMVFFFPVVVSPEFPCCVLSPRHDFFLRATADVAARCAGRFGFAQA